MGWRAEINLYPDDEPEGWHSRGIRCSCQPEVVYGEKTVTVVHQSFKPEEKA